MANQTQDLEQIAKSALQIVERMGLDWVKESQEHAPHLEYGLKHGVYDQSAVDGAQTKFRQNSAKTTLRTVESMGIDWVKGSHHAPDLIYGLEHRLYDQSAVDGAQGRYEASRIT